MGCCCVRGRCRCYVSVTLMLLMLAVADADFCVGHTCQLRGFDLSSVPLPPLRATLSISLSLSLFQLRVMGGPRVVLCFLRHEILLYSVCLDIFLFFCYAHDVCLFFLFVVSSKAARQMTLSAIK